MRLQVVALGTSERADWQKRLGATEKRRVELETQVAELPPKPLPSEENAEESTPPATEPRMNRRNGPNNFMAMMDRPDVQRLVAVQQRSALDGQYSALFRSLGLTPDQLDRFKDLLVEKQTAMMDVFAAAREQGINPRSDPQAYAKLLATAQAEVDGTIRSTIGETAFAKYDGYQQTLPQRSLVDQLEQRLSYSSTPLSAQQSEQMVAILAATTKKTTTTTTNRPMISPMAGSSAFGGAVATASRITGATIDQSLGVLAAPQVEALRQLQAEQQAQAALNAAMRNRGQGTGAASGGTAPGTAAPRPSGG